MSLYSYCAQALSVSVNGESVGTVRERATWWNPVFHIFDSVGNQVFKIRQVCVNSVYLAQEQKSLCITGKKFTSV